ncbi:PepSY domain-containing protein [Methylobacterium sp. J-090]|uniref:PepSY domain-containing protein n=1 Tax=Methylobacterium sp. J-090 TaxID=2836666 RepID=UPI00391D052E
MKFGTLVPLVLAMALGFAGPVLAKEDKPGADWMPAEQVKQKLMDAGYSSITELEADDGHWEGEGLKNGVKMEFHVDPRTGAITKEKPDKD